MKQADGYVLARTLVRFALAALLLVGPVNLFVTWWGDCSEAACPRATALDLLVYASNVVAWVGLAIVVFRRYGGRAWPFVLAFGLWLGAQVIAGWLGARGFVFAWVLVPAAAQLVAAGIIGLATSRGWVPADGRWSASISTIGCAAYPVAYLVLFGANTVGSGQPGGWLLVVLPIMAIVIAVILATRFAGPEPGSP